MGLYGEKKMTHLLTAAILCILVLLGTVEWIGHRRRLLSVPIRIHVNGSRGKSSVTRLLAAAARESGLKTIARTTGTFPRHILEDGSELPVRRYGAPRILELIETVKIASERDADILIVECMALRPEYQYLSESKLIQSTHGIITNVREDHLDVMGPSVEDVAAALSKTIPKNGILITSESKHISVFEARAIKQSTLIQLPEAADFYIESDREKRISDFPENTALVRTMCRELGIKDDTAISGMAKAVPDPGILSVFDIDTNAGKVRAVNAFSANDPESTELIIRDMEKKGHLEGQMVIIYNHRDDRGQRGIAFCNLFSKLDKHHYVAAFLLIGKNTLPIFSRMRRLGIGKDKIIREYRSTDPNSLMKKITAAVDSRKITDMQTIATLIGLGNFAGPAYELVQCWQRSGRKYA